MPTNDLSARMAPRRKTGAGAAAKTTKSTAKTTRTRAQAEPEPAPLEVERSAGKPYPHRVSLDLDPSDYGWLRDAAYRARVRNASVLRALMRAAQEDQDLLAKVLEDAKTLEKEARQARKV